MQLCGSLCSEKLREALRSRGRGASELHRGAHGLRVGQGGGQPPHAHAHGLATAASEGAELSGRWRVSVANSVRRGAKEVKGKGLRRALRALRVKALKASKASKAQSASSDVAMGSMESQPEVPELPEPEAEAPAEVPVEAPVEAPVPGRPRSEATE